MTLTWHRRTWRPWVKPVAHVLELLDEDGQVWARVHEDGRWTAWREPGSTPYHGPRPDPPKVCSAQRYAARWVAHARRPR